ncbi:hypothetical protein [Dactylosporangium salmoneum]|uniref:OmpA-like domain-containing protein n=1 Tax=Dactylosporangium salmoneum TaxID=53361 RepID=A0ABN3GMA8_9ACTN
MPRWVCTPLRSAGANVGTSIFGFGGTHPAVVGGTPQSRAENRRVVVVVTG